MSDTRSAADRPTTQAFQELVNDMLARGIRFRFQAKGRSMLPLIQDGEFVHVEPAGATALRVGDVVLSRAEHEVKLHRIIRRNSDSVITKGDASIDADDPIHQSCVLGKVVAKECSATRRLMKIDGLSARLGFYLRQARRKLAMTVRDIFPSILSDIGTRQ